MNRKVINAISLIIFFTLVILVAFSNHNQIFLKSRQFKFLFILILVISCCYNKCLALILLIVYISISDFNIEGMESAQVSDLVVDKYKQMFCKDCGKSAIEKIKAGNSNDLEKLFSNIFFSSGVNSNAKKDDEMLKHYCEDPNLKMYVGEEKDNKGISNLDKFKEFLGIKVSNDQTNKKPSSQRRKTETKSTVTPSDCLKTKFLVGDNSKKQLAFKKVKKPVSLVDHCVKGLTVTSNNSKVNSSDLTKLLEGNASFMAKDVGEQDVYLTFTFPETVTLDGFTFSTYMYPSSTGVIKSWQLKDENENVIINGPEVDTGGTWSILTGTADKVVQSKPGSHDKVSDKDIINFTPRASRVWHLRLKLTKDMYIYYVRFHGLVGGTPPQPVISYSNTAVSKGNATKACKELGSEWTLATKKNIADNATLLSKDMNGEIGADSWYDNDSTYGYNYYPKEIGNWLIANPLSAYDGKINAVCYKKPKHIYCSSDFGKTGEPCCGVSKSTMGSSNFSDLTAEHTCSEDLPKCEGYKPGYTWGTCKAK